MLYLFQKFESGILVSGVSTVWEHMNGFSKKYMCALVIYLINVLSSSYGIIMDCATNAPDNGNIVVDIINATDKNDLK